MTLRLYDYPASANCYKARLLLAQLELEYERVPVDIFAGDTLTREFARKNPALTTPVLEVGPGEYLPESNAILLHLSEDTDPYPNLLQWLEAVRIQPGHVADLAPYPPNSRRGRSKSIYDRFGV